MTQSQHPTDPTTHAEVAPGEGPEPGSVEYGGSEIHDDHVGQGSAPAGGGVTTSPTGGGVTTEAGTFEELPVTPDEQGD